MSEYCLFTDSSCDLPSALADKMELRVAPLTATIGGADYVNYLDEREIKLAEYYRMLREKMPGKTSAVNVDVFLKMMTPELEAGRDILYLSFSTGLSGTYNAGEVAATELRAKFPDRKIYTVDTLCASMGEGLIDYLVWQKKQAGATIEEARDYAESIKLHVCHWFTVEDLHHLKRGGRVSAATAVVGTLLSIKPVMHVDDAGKLINMEKARGRNASLSRLVQIVAERADPPLSEQTVFISHGDCEAEAEKVAAMLKQKGAKDVIVSVIGPVIGTHSGPGTMALFFLGKER